MHEATGVKFATDKQFKNKYKDKCCLIIGGGYRLKQDNKEYARCENLDKWRGITIGCNSAYKVRKLDILVWQDISTGVVYHDDLKNLDCIKFVSSPTEWEPVDIDFYGVRMGPIMCSESFEYGIYPEEYSGFFAINIALVLGFKNIFLTGFCPEGKMAKHTPNIKMYKDYGRITGQKIISTDKHSCFTEFIDYQPLEDVLNEKTQT